MDTSLDGINKYMKDVLDLDEKYRLNHLHAPTMINLGYFSLALGGEVGELLNVVKKIWRDGESEKLWDDLAEELVDIVIYLLEIINLVGVDFDKKWEEKQQVLLDRFKNRVKDYRIEDRDLDLGRKEV